MLKSTTQVPSNVSAFLLLMNRLAKPLFPNALYAIRNKTEEVNLSAGPLAKVEDFAANWIRQYGSVPTHL